MRCVSRSGTRGGANEREARMREREALHTAEKALRVKDEFLAMLSLSCDVLNAISGWVQIIKSIPEPDRIAPV